MIFYNYHLIKLQNNVFIDPKATGYPKLSLLIMPPELFFDHF